MKDGIFSKLAAVPILALFLAVAILMGRIGMDWTPSNTETVIGGLLAICGGGIALFGIILGGIVGVAIYARIRRSGQEEEMGWRSLPPMVPPSRTLPGPGQSPYYAPLPPVQGDILDDKQGFWRSSGPGSYDVYFPDEEAIDGSWQ